MPAYTFHSLSPADFEDLVCDLLGADFRTRFQVFTRGKDLGIDLLQGDGVHGATVVQCKHYWQSGYARLRSVIESKELPKVRKLSPHRYILATSVGLTPPNKEELHSMLRPYCKGVHDIYGLDDINALLRAYPDVESTHYKLWLTSTAVLQRVLRHGQAVWSAIEKTEIERKMSLYVRTDAYPDALKILAEHNYCVISGIPGIGKTTLARILVTRLLEDGFQLITVREDISEAFDVLDSSRRQVVYYDDFLGLSSVGERLGKNEDQGILRLLGAAKRSKVLKVILTTREYILADARRLYERLSGPELDIAKCIVKVEQYTRRHRARILYNHVYLSELPHAYVAALLADGNYRKIIDHANYSPRIVEWMTGSFAAEGIRAEEFPQAFLSALDDPTGIWDHAFENQLDEDARSVLLCLGTVTGSIGLDDLRDAWGLLLASGDDRTLTLGERTRFRSAVNQLDGSFLRTTRSHTEVIVGFHNPSVRDFVAHRIVADRALLTQLLDHARYFEQVSCVLRLDREGRVGSQPAGLLSDGPVLRAAIERTLCNPSPTFEVIRYRDGGKVWRRRNTDVGARLAEAASWARALSSEEFLDFLCVQADALISSGEIARVGTVDACGFVESIVRAWPPSGGKWEPLVKCLIDGIGEELTDTASSEDWMKWTTFVGRNNALFDSAARAHWEERAREFCECEIETIRQNAESLSEAEAWLDEVKEIARCWDIDLEFGLEDLQEHISELASREGGEPDWDSEDYHRWDRDVIPRGETDAEIDHLFRSLDERNRT